MNATSDRSIVAAAAAYAAVGALLLISLAFIGVLPMVTMALIYGGAHALWIALGCGVMVLAALVIVAGALGISTRGSGR